MLGQTNSRAQMVAALLSELRQVGYRGELLQQKYLFQDWLDPARELKEVPIAAFGQLPPSYGTACIAVVFSNGRTGPELISQVRSLGAPFAIEVQSDSFVRWRVSTKPTSTDIRDKFSLSAISRYFTDKRDVLSPQSILRAKNISLDLTDKQSEIDFGLVPAIENEIRSRLDPLIRDLLAGAQALSYDRNGDISLRQVYRVVFWFLAAKVLHDRDVEPFDKMTIASDPAAILQRVSQYYSEPAPRVSAKVATFVHTEMWSSLDFRNLSLEVLALIYENTLVDSDIRKAHGVHATPPAIARYIANSVDLSRFPEDERFIVEPCCGHATFLISALGILRDLLPTGTSNKRRHLYLRDRLIGFEIDEFAVEVARLGLMLADFPNDDGWKLSCGSAGDVFRSPDFLHSVSRASVVLCNPPFGPFSLKDRRQLETRFAAKPAELLSRVLDVLPDRSAIGFVMPRQVVDGRGYKKLRRRLVERFEELEVIALPDQGVFESAEIETALVIGRGARQGGSAAAFKYSALAKSDVARFKALRVLPGVVDTTATLSSAEEGLRVPALVRLWEFLRDAATLGSVTERIARGIEWNVPLATSRSKLIAQRPQAGFRRGLSSASTGMNAFELPHASFLSMAQPTRRGGAHDLPWDTPKVITNAKRRSRGRWRLAAAADRSGLVCYQTYTCVWPATDWSAEVVAAVLNGAVANAYIAAHEDTRDITVETLRRIPMPALSRLDAVKVEELVAEYVRIVSESPLKSVERSAADVLEEIDQHVLAGYALPSTLRTELADHMRGHRRPVAEGAEFGGWWSQSSREYTIEYAPEVVRTLQLLDPNVRFKVMAAIQELPRIHREMWNAQRVISTLDLYTIRVGEGLIAVLNVRPDRTVHVRSLVNRAFASQFLG